jgi:arylsulfatase B
MKRILLTTILLTLTLFVSAQRNVILIIADDLSPDYFGFYPVHGDTADVPNIRSLLSKGVQFNNAMSNPVCSSTRSAILTGRYGFRTGVGAIVGGAGGSGQLDTSELTIPRLLNIYNTNIGKANIGKWHLHQAMPVSQLQNPNVLGYDHFEGPFIGAIPNFYNWTKYTNGISGPITTYATSENVNNAVSWIKTQNANPFFLWLAFNAPHEPLHLPPAGFYTNTSLSGTMQDINANPKSYFKADLEALDHEIGRLFDSLQVLNKLDSTDFIFIGDNGNTIRTTQIPITNHSKGTIYQYGVHVPFIISGPSVVNPGRSTDALVNTADIFSTVLELFGYNNWQSQIPANKPVDSKSIYPLILNQGTTVRSWAFCEIFKITTDSVDGKAIRNSDYKLINFNYGKQEFYNLTIDSLELNDLLTGTLSANDIINYNYLCNEMTNLVGSGNFCTSVSGLSENVNSTVQDIVYPNPFDSFIKLKKNSGYEEYELRNSFGQLIYSGNNIEFQDFSALESGMYYLKIIDRSTLILKVIKK